MFDASFALPFLDAIFQGVRIKIKIRIRRGGEITKRERPGGKRLRGNFSMHGLPVNVSNSYNQN
jgi:hypothetical protein